MIVLAVIFALVVIYGLSRVPFVRLARAGAVLALAVVMLGAWVRLTDAGLGCPDWPGCYGRLVVPETNTSAAELGAEYARPLEAGKAWREMIHRYLASTLGLVCVALAVSAWRNRRDPNQPWRVPLVLVALVVFQGLLGMWTVLQIFLGGWTSANYAALACPDFPTCQTQWWPAVADFEEGFVLWRGLGIDYEGGVLDHPALVAVHFTHRLGAILATVLIALLGWRLAREVATRVDGTAVLAALLAQLCLGVSIVWFGVPLAVAVLHNGVAALLLLTVINANQRIRQR
jgi:cytochrome c oxidase assembly protein subunit 15